jgi:hypothetical protein
LLVSAADKGDAVFVKTISLDTRIAVYFGDLLRDFAYVAEMGLLAREREKRVFRARFGVTSKRENGSPESEVRGGIRSGLRPSVLGRMGNLGLRPRL